MFDNFTKLSIYLFNNHSISNKFQTILLICKLLFFRKSKTKTLKSQNDSKIERENFDANDLTAFDVLKKSFKFILPFKHLVIITFFFNSLFSALSTMSIALINPVFGILFNGDSGTGGTQGMATPLGSSYKNFYTWIYKLIYSSTPESTLINLSILIITVFFFKNLFKYIGNIYSIRLENNIIKSIKDKIFESLMYLSLDFYSKSRQGHLISVLTNDVGTLNGTSVSTFSIVLRELVQIFLSLFLLLSISTKLTLIAFSTSIISILLIRYSVQHLRRYASRIQSAMSDYTTTLQESISGIRVIKAYVAEKVIADKFKRETQSFVKSIIKNEKVSQLIPAINEISAISALCIVLYVGGTDVIVNKSFRGQDLMTFLFALFSIMSPITTTINTVSGFQKGLIAGRRIFGIIDAPVSIQSGSKDIFEFNQKIEVKNVSFGYNHEREVLKNVSFTLEKGKKIAFVGLSGSGKSTMLDLLIRFYDPTSGTISIDGNQIKTLNLPEYRRLFGIVSQETMLFNDSLENNIRYGNDSISLERIEIAVKVANAEDFINKSSNGLKTLIGDRGATLSGGERQRIAIARAIVREPEILIFDEATSALDAKNESIVQEGINSALENRTAIIVAHRLSTIRNCDEILVFEQGEIAERGTHTELLELNGIYKKLCDIQFNSKKD